MSRTEQMISIQKKMEFKIKVHPITASSLKNSLELCARLQGCVSLGSGFPELSDTLMDVTKLLPPDMSPEVPGLG